ncbi:pyruvate kinase [Candidatus Saccharibacteria bacterium]|nr:pyruvate kinase [Candidatus Saccharibacteria bacterium]MBI3338245.1 pyruvate kinase [Candidatus Saccharibacteria bacterium]
MAQTTSKAPNVPVTKFKRTKIIATVGPSTDSYEQILALIKAGANGLRLNFSHGTNEERERQIKWIRKASQVYGKPVAIIQDLQGPKIRLGDFDGIINVHTNQSLVFEYGANYELSGHIPVQYDISKKVKRGERLYLYDGKVQTIITSVQDRLVHVVVENDGILIKRKGINLPDTDFEGDIITIKDKKDLVFGSTIDIDYVALSFVQSATDVRHLKRQIKNLGSNVKVIAKIETKAAIDNLESIVQEADVIMIARGDLAIETLPESVPIVQRQIIGLGLKYAKPTIVATQMLATMNEAPEPTRAEVSDIATAVLVGADCVMLSDETASGQYPIDAVKVMKRVILYTQYNAPLKVNWNDPQKEIQTRQNAICGAIIALADGINAKAIVAETKSGATALQIAARRPERPIITVTPDPRVSQQLAIVYGTKNYVRPDDKLAAKKLTNWLQQNKVLKKGDMVVTAFGQYPGMVGTTDTIKVRVLE